MGGWGGGWAPLGSAAIRRSGRCSRRRGSPAWPPGAAAPGPGSVAGGLGRTWTRDQGPRPLPGRIPSPREHPRPGGCVANQPRRLAVWGRAGDSNLREEKKHGSRWFVFTRPLKACSSARWLSFFATFFGKAPQIRKRRAEHLQAQVSPKKLFSKVGFAAAAQAPGQGEVQTPARAGWRGGSVCALARGPSGGHGCSERAARPLRSGPARADRWTRRGSVGRSAHRLAALGVLCGLRAAAAPAYSLQRGWGGGAFFFSPLLSLLRVCVCVCAQNISLEKERWALPAGGEPSGRQRGRQAGCSRLQEKLPPFSCSGLYKGEGRVQEVGGDSLSSPGPESAPGGGGRSQGRARGEDCSLRGL